MAALLPPVKAWGQRSRGRRLAVAAGLGLAALAMGLATVTRLDVELSLAFMAFTNPARPEASGNGPVRPAWWSSYQAQEGAVKGELWLHALLPPVWPGQCLTGQAEACAVVQAMRQDYAFWPADQQWQAYRRNWLASGCACLGAGLCAGWAARPRPRA